MSCRRHHLMNILTFPVALKMHFQMLLFYVGSLVQCFRFRIWVQISWSDKGLVRSLLFPYLVAHLLVNPNLLTSYVFRCSFTKPFWILPSHEVRAQKLIHDTIQTHAFQPATVLPNISSFCVWNSATFFDLL